MKIRMLKTENGSVDGIKVTAYNAGEVYDLTGSQGARELAAAFVGAKMAVEVKDEPVSVVRPVTPASIEEKVETIADENKAEQLAPENKVAQPVDNKRTGKRKG